MRQLSPMALHDVSSSVMKNGTSAHFSLGPKVRRIRAVGKSLNSGKERGPESGASPAP